MSGSEVSESEETDVSDGEDRGVPVGGHDGVSESDEHVKEVSKELDSGISIVQVSLPEVSLVEDTAIKGVDVGVSVSVHVA